MAATMERAMGSAAPAIAGVADSSRAHWNLNAARLDEYALRRKEGELAQAGPLAVETGEHTGRSPRDKYVVRQPPSASRIWWGEVNHPLTPAAFDVIARTVDDYLSGRELFVEDLYAGADPAYRLRVRVVSESAWSALFARNLFIVPSDEQRTGDAGREPDVTILHAPLLTLDPARTHTRSSTAIVVNLERGLILIAGTRYAGEIKKSVFGLLQYLLPRRGVATMHCSANAGPDGSTALFFGLSGTGKTTLSTDP